MASAWPSGLQDRLETSGFNFKIGETLLRSEMDTGPYKSRKRATKALDKITGNIILERAEVVTFRTFYDVTLNNGSDSFTYTDPITQDPTDYKFIDPPSLTSLGGNYYSLSMNWILA